LAPLAQAQAGDEVKAPTLLYGPFWPLFSAIAVAHSSFATVLDWPG